MFPTLPILLSFSALFGGRTDAYFLSLAKGGRATYEQVTLSLFADHIMGRREIGTYPVNNAAQCRWGCIDIDNPDDAAALESASDVMSVWAYLRVHSWLERSRSKGYHVWVFSDGWLSANIMRDAGRYVALIAELDPKTEINPKNAAHWLVPNGLVNTVRTPYSGRAAPGRMRMISEQGGDIELPDFLRSAVALRTKPATLAPLAQAMRDIDRAAERQRLMAMQSFDSGLRPTRRYSGTTQAAARIVQGLEVPERGERDNQFYAMAKYMHGIDMPADEALDVMARVWEQTDSEGFPLEEALSKVRRVYGV